MENLDQARETDFDQSVEEMEQLEAQEKELPHNEKIKKYLREVREHIDKLLEELDAESARGKSKDIGEQALAVNTEKAENVTERPDDRMYVDSQGFVHKTPGEAKDNDPDDWRR